MPANLEYTIVVTGLKNIHLILIPKKVNGKDCSKYCKIALISQVSKVLLKIIQARFKEYVDWELPDVQTGFKKCRGTRD